MREIIASIDIGSSKIKIVVGEIIEERLNVLCALEEDSRGVKKGAIVEPEETVYALKKLLKKTEEILGVKVTKAIVSVNEEAADFKIGEATNTITSEDKEITASDVVRVLQSSVRNKVDKALELVTVIPIMFKVDDRKTRVPKGMRGEKISVKSVVVSVPKRDVYLSAKCLEKCGVEVIDIMLGSIGAYYAHRNESTDTLTGVLIDCGAETIKVAVFNKGIIINNLVIGYGGKNVDNDISFIYKLDDDQSRKIKEKFALANKRYASQKEKIELTNNLGEKITINQYELTEVVMSRLHEMLNLAKNEINYLTKKEISYIIVTGGLTELKDFPLEIESIFGRNASIGKIPIVGVRDNKYASCVGMIKYFDYKLKLRDREYSILSQDDLELLSGSNDKRIISSDSILWKIFGIFFDN